MKNLKKQKVPSSPNFFDYDFAWNVTLDKYNIAQVLCDKIKFMVLDAVRENLHKNLGTKEETFKLAQYIVSLVKVEMDKLIADKALMCHGFVFEEKKCIVMGQDINDHSSASEIFAFEMAEPVQLTLIFHEVSFRKKKISDYHVFRQIR